MKIRFIGSLLCGGLLILATQTGALAAQSYAASNIRHPPGVTTTGGGNKANTTTPRTDRMGGGGGKVAAPSGTKSK